MNSIDSLIANDSLGLLDNIYDFIQKSTKGPYEGTCLTFTGVNYKQVS